MSEELKPCPFCGGEAMLKRDHRWPHDCGNRPVDAYEVVCLNMDCIIYRADTVYYLTEAEAIEAWNTRTPEQAIAATLGGGECELVYGENDEGVDSWFTQCGGRFNATFEDRHMVHPKFCQLCGRKAVKR